jgi:hypothetical protein
MGYMKHSITCIAVGGFDKEKLHEVEAYVALLPTDIAPLVVKSHSVVNDLWFFTVLPDGSKEGWSESDHFDDVRRHLVGLCPRQAIDVYWGGDEAEERGFNNDVPPRPDDE